MCVAAITEEILAESTVEVDKTDGTIRVKVTDKDGYLVLDTRYAYVSHWAESGSELHVLNFYRLYSGQLMDTGVTFEMDYAPTGGPKVVAKNTGSMIAGEMLILLNAVMWQDYAITGQVEGKWGIIEEVTFEDNEKVEEDKAHAKRMAKSQSLAEQLIR